MHTMAIYQSHNLHNLIILFACSVRLARSVTDYSNNNDAFDWLNGDDDDDFEDFSPVRVEDEHLAGKMNTFFDKLNSMRRRHHELKLQRQSDHLQPFIRGYGPESGRHRTSGKDGDWQSIDDLLLPVQRKSKEIDKTVLHYDKSPNSSDDDRKTNRPNEPSDANETGDGDAAAVEHIVIEAGRRDDSLIGMRDDSSIGIRDRSKETETGRTERPRPAGKLPRPSAAYLKMGLQSARCLWRQYQASKTEQESRAASQQLKAMARFWAVVIGISIAFLWCVYGFFHELFCFAVAAPPADYAQNVNRYLTMVPPHVVVTDKGKMYRYQATAEERYLWEYAKKLANFRV